MKITKILSLLIVLLLAACDRMDMPDSNQLPPDGGDGIRFEIQISGSDTRATTTNDFKSSFTDGDVIGIFAVSRAPGTTATLQSDGSNYINNAKLVRIEDTDIWYIDNNDEPLWYPTNGNVLDFYAYFPYDPQATDPTTINFALKNDQRSADKFDMNHLMVATPVTALQNQMTKLVMNHLTALVQVELGNADLAIDPNGNPEVLLNNVGLAGAINLNATEIADMVTLEEASRNNVSMQRMETDVETAATYTYRALVPAQTMPSGTKLLRIHNGNEIWESEAPDKETKLIAGNVKKHRQVLPFTMHTERIRAGKFWMGDDRWPGGSDDAPPHHVTLTKSFYMSKYEVTNAQFCAFLNAYPHLIYAESNYTVVVAKPGEEAIDWFGESISCRNTMLFDADTDRIRYVDEQWVPVPGYEMFPVHDVTWHGALLFCKWAGGRLPTEAEWEYACRAGSYREFPMGADGVQITGSNLNNYEWFRTNSGLKEHRIGTRLPNAWGLYDMIGNVSEWCYDRYADDFYDDTDYDIEGGEAGVVDPVNITTEPASERVVRGGHWGESSPYPGIRYHLNTSSRYSSYSYNYTLGFRVVFPID